MNLDKKRWIILLAGCFINLCLGSIYAWSVFSAAMTDYFNATMGGNITPGDLAIVYTIANSVGPITMISGGWFNDKFGPKKVILVGGIMWGLGMFLSGFATSVGYLIATYGIIGGLGLGMAYGSVISTCVKFFPDKRGLIGGITTAVYGASSVILPPIVTSIVSRTDASFAFKLVGIIFIVLIAVSCMFLEQCPEGYTPSGYVVAAAGSDTKIVNKDWKEMLKTPEQLADIAISACDTVKGLLDWEPRCAMICYSTLGSGQGELIDKVKEALAIANEKRPDLDIDGEFQLDAAIVPAVAAKKVNRESKVAGKANVLIWPDLNVGNTAVKLIQQFGHADAYGPMLQGFNSIVCDCSRGAPVSEIKGNVVISAVRAMGQKK